MQLIIFFKNQKRVAHEIKNLKNKKQHAQLLPTAYVNVKQKKILKINPSENEEHYVV